MNTKTIWRRPINVDHLNQHWADGLIAHVGIRFTEVGQDFLVATMPVDITTQQAFGLLHGGASAVLIESLASTAGTCSLEEPFYCVGVEVNANHVRVVRSGTVTGVARPIHLGKTIQVWGVDIRDDSNLLVCIGRMTLTVQSGKK